MFYITVTIGALLMVLSMRGMSITETLVIFAIAAPITYFLVRVFCRVMQLRAMDKRLAAEAAVDALIESLPKDKTP